MVSGAQHSKVPLLSVLKQFLVCSEKVRKQKDNGRRQCHYFMMKYKESDNFWKTTHNGHLKTYIMVRAWVKKIFVKCWPYCRKLQQIGFGILTDFEITAWEFLEPIFWWQNTMRLGNNISFFHLCKIVL